MSNLKHGHYSTNVGINPDSVMVTNISIKNLLLGHQNDINDVIHHVIVRPGVVDLVVRLLDYALPQHDHLIDERWRVRAIEYYHSNVFQRLNSEMKDHSLERLVELATHEW